MNATASFNRRNLYTPLELPGGVTVTVERYATKAQGGPALASMTARGPMSALYGMLSWARCGVEITNYLGERCWWGYISKLVLVDQSVTITVDIERMSNYVAMAYTLVAAGESTTGPRRTTDWVYSADSASEFGRKELLDSMGGTNETHAEARRDRTLALYQYPFALPQIDPATSQGEAKLTIECLGWWETLSWRYATVPALLAFAYSTIGTTTQTLGKSPSNELKLAQGFKAGAAGWNLQAVALYVSKTGSPAGDLAVSIHEVATGGTPGTSLGSVTVSAADIATAYGWILFTLSSPVSLTANTSYFIQVATTELSADNYYSFLLDSAQGYADGSLYSQLSGGSTWSAVAADMPFRIYTNALVENTQQVRSLLTDYGQFLRQVYIEDAAGVTSESYRNGDSDAQFEIEELLESGTSGGKRLLAKVLPGRDVQITDEGDRTLNTPYSVDRDGTFWHYDRRLDPTTCPSGFWCRLRDVLPDSLNVSQLSGLTAFFIESTEYDAAQGRLRYTALGLENVFDLIDAEVG